ncbi:hypothetical protein [Microbulbifer sp. TB1203]|uniref:hypothetical protein n=1 Tax=Microbulbifer sp. TB1203 TaxID=3021712 RepID=UPI0027E40AA0|nr:hypothetical protein [Microbulbifer sp. TB1203]
MSIIIKNLVTGDPNVTWNPGAVLSVIGTLELSIGHAAVQKNITRLTIVRRADVEDGHWELFLEGNEGLCVKIDLTVHGYRIIYGAGIPQVTAETDPVQIHNATLGQMVECLVTVSTARGDWTGTQLYNCQDFAVEFMKELNRQQISTGQGLSSRSFKYELMRKVRKNRSPLDWMDTNSIRDLYGL